MANRTSFRVGNTASVGHGRPKKEWTMASLIRDALEKKGVALGGNKAPVRKIIAERLADMALNGDIIAIKEINNRIDGMPKQTIDATVTLPEPIYGSKSKL